ncbi:VOC family protein [Streptomyces sp. NP160]|uniref:VOC family protein n=1 Tax=Streptomyces sp. NP160 TaxID=2586637 RepID=UPI0011191664|nr:VOC family protein [Streptomyces sp. NP160]TNM67147.1 VOC family protein [Streptomyces sp. NP160]
MSDEADHAPVPGVQVVVDCADPHAQAEFWAATLGYEVEDVEPLVRRMLDAGYATDADVLERSGVLVWRDAAAIRDPGGARPRLYLQRVPEPKTVKNRVHLDLHVGPERVDAEVSRLEGLGATRAGEGRQGPQRWVVMTDPEGNELCLS